MTNSPSVDRDDSPSIMLGLEPRADREHDEIDRPPAMMISDLDLTASPSDEPMTHTVTTAADRQKSEQKRVVQSITIPSTGRKLDVIAEVDLLLHSLELAIPHPPDSEPKSDSESLEIDRAHYHHQFLQQLNTTREQLVSVCSEIQSWHQRDRVDLEEIDAQVSLLNQIKLRSEQLNQDSSHQIAKVQNMLATVKQVHTDIFTGLEKFGGVEQIQSMLSELQTTRDALVIAHDRLETGQDAFYESLQAIQAEVATQSSDATQKLREYQNSIQNLTQTISTDRLQIAGMSMDMSIKFTELHRLHSQTTNMHGQMMEKSQTFQTQITEIEREFTELAKSVRQDKDQFYELTVETIDKADAMRSQLANMTKEIIRDRDEIANLKAEIISIRQNLDREAEEQLDRIDLEFYELISNCNDLNQRNERKDRNKKLLMWLWGLSFAVGIIIVLLIRVLMSLQ
jgi:hypothetical protein